MERFHTIVGACAVALAGAATGASINTTPIHDGVGGMQFNSSHSASTPSLADFERVAAPVDQYALVTPRRRFDVGELRDRGLYSQPRYGGGWHEAVYREPAYQAATSDYAPDYGYDGTASDAASPAAAPGPAPLTPPDLPAPRVAAASAKPLAESEKPVSIAVQPRMIDVSAVLASR